MSKTSSNPNLKSQLHTLLRSETLSQKERKSVEKFCKILDSKWICFSHWKMSNPAFYHFSTSQNYFFKIIFHLWNHLFSLTVEIGDYINEMNDPSRTTSTSSYTDFSASKGLDNHKGQNNCWLNATIQLLWHQDGFRESLHRLRKLGHFRCRQKQCVYCQIQNLLKKYIYEWGNLFLIRSNLNIGRISRYLRMSYEKPSHL